MLRRAQRRVEALGFVVDLCQCPAEALPFANASFNTVVATLVLCSVADIDAALSELRRVLRANGTLRFIEHVRADGSVGRIQDILTPLQRRIAGGCHLNRRTIEAIEAAGFVLVEIEEQQVLFTPLVAGVATLLR
jgi:ubiquinone/menaquinone biosynthesis C-methylase UbiE